MIRHGAELVHAYAAATVPRLCVVLRKAYGGAYIVMDSRGIGNDLCVAWPSAEIAVMGAAGAVAILNKGRTDAGLVEEYRDAFENPYRAAERGLVDAVIEPVRTRHVLVDALDVLVQQARQRGRPAGTRTHRSEGDPRTMLLADKRILVTGVLNDASMAFHVAQRAQEEGAEVVLTSFGRAMSLTQRAARRLPTEPSIVELDVTDAAHLDALAGTRRRPPRRRAARDRLRTRVVPRRRLPHRAVGRRRRRAPGERVLVEGARGRVPAADDARAAASSGLDFDNSRVAWPVYDWMGVAKAAFESTARYLARDLGARRHPRQPRRGRTDPHDRGPEHPRLRAVRGRVGRSARRSAGTSRIPRPVAAACVALFSDLFPATTGEVDPRRRRLPRHRRLTRPPSNRWRGSGPRRDQPRQLLVSENRAARTVSPDGGQRDADGMWRYGARRSRPPRRRHEVWDNGEPPRGS